MNSNDKLRRPTRHHSYLLRLWREDEETPWRASLQDLKTGESRGFGSPEALIRFIRHIVHEPDT